MINKKYFYKIKKKFGQNFLNNLYINKKIISIIKIKNNYNVIEIGSGFGILTKMLILNINKINLIEIDKELIIFLKKYLQIKKKKILIYKKSILKINLSNIAKKEKNLLFLIGNIPYNISTKILLYIINFFYYIKKIYFMLQKEFAERIISILNKQYSRLSVIIKYYFIIKPIFKISNNSFVPKPKINSILINLKPKKKKYFVNKINILKFIIKKSFQQRRKKIKNNLKNIFTEKQFKKININSNIRSENISLFEYCLLTNLLTINFFLKNKYFKI